MKRVLDRALAQIQGPIPELRAVVLSATPDGLIAWCWSRDGKADVALGFAALDRAATACLQGLGASLRSRNLLLTAEDVYVAAWPLYDDDASRTETEEADDPGLLSPRLVLTAVFTGALQRGMVMLHATRIRLHLREALEHALSADASLRRELVALLRSTDEPADGVRRLVESSGVDLRRLTRLDDLNPHEREQLRAAIARLRAAPLLN